MNALTLTLIIGFACIPLGIWYGRRRHRHLAIRHRIAHYSHLGG